MTFKIKSEGTGAARLKALDSAEKQEIRRNLSESWVDLKNLEKSYGKDLRREDDILLTKLKAQIRALMAAIDADIAGITPATGAGATGETEGSEGDDSATGGMDTTDVPSGWSGDISVVAPDNARVRADREYIAAHQAEYGDFAGKVYVTGGVDSKMGLTLDAEFEQFVQSKTGSPISELKIRNRGRDALVTVVSQNGKKLTFTVAGKAKIIVNASRLPHSIKIDASHYYGNKLFITGTMFDDIIYGSQRDDSIQGLSGSDTIHAMGGKDKVYGDFEEAFRAAHGYEEAAEGDDYVFGGGDQLDMIDGGGGIDTDFNADATQARFGFEEHSNHIPVFDPSTINERDWFVSSIESGSRNWQWEFDGRVTEVTHNGVDGGELTLKLPPGFHSAFGTMDRNDLRVTMVGEKNGSPVTFVVVIENFVNNGRYGENEPMKLNIEGNDQDNIIDFGQVGKGTDHVMRNVIHIKGGAGDDMLIAPQNALIKDGLTWRDMQQSSDILGTLHQPYIDQNGLFPNLNTNTDAAQNNWDATSNGREIVLQKGNNAEIAGQQISISAPAGFKNGYYYWDSQPDGKKDMIVVLVKKEPGSKPETIVIRIKNVKSNTSIHASEIPTPPTPSGIDGEAPPQRAGGGSLNLIPLMNDPRQTYLDGGTGDDMGFGSDLDIIDAESKTQNPYEETEES